MFSYPYETTPCAQYVLDDVRKALQRSMVEEALRPLEFAGGKTIPTVVMVTPSRSAIPVFSQPLHFTHFGRELLAVDVRPFTREAIDGTLKIAAPAEFEFLKARTVLTYGWVNDGAETMAGMTDLPMLAFSRWISEAIVRRLGLSPAEQMQLSMLSAYYYLCLHRDNTPLSEREKTAWTARIARTTRVGAEAVFQMLDSVPVMGDVIDFTQQCATFVNTARLERFTAGLLYSMLGGSWFGANSKETAAVAIEHPPTFMAMLYAAVVDRSFRNAGFSRLVEQLNRNSAHKHYLTALVAYMESLADD